MAADTGDRSRRARPFSGVLALFLVQAAACGPSTVEPLYDPGGGGTQGAFDWLGRTVPTTSAQAMTVKVDPDMTLTAAPGQGVGVFVEYRAGGHWQVSWSCDTLLSGQSCQYDVAISTLTGQSGALSNVMALPPVADDRVTQPSPQAIDVTSLTSTALDGLTLDAPAGSSIQMAARLGGGTDAISIFFVQDGKVNGGYTGALTDPLVLEPSSP